jgi:putative NADH-flavin reductase
VKAILLGATGMVGQGVLRECLLDPEVQSVLTIGRNATAQRHEKLQEIVHQDLSDLTAIEGKLSGYGACFFCLGVSGRSDVSLPVWRIFGVSIHRTETVVWTSTLPLIAFE